MTASLPHGEQHGRGAFDDGGSGWLIVAGGKPLQVRDKLGPHPALASRRHDGLDETSGDSGHGPRGIVDRDGPAADLVGHRIFHRLDSWFDPLGADAAVIISLALATLYVLWGHS